MRFEDYCHSKHIDYAKLKMEQPSLLQELEDYFDQVHPESFTQQKKFLINPLRREYKWEGQEA